jgi:pimeloyl-ACP methyl ester carboxylesterase
MIEASEVPPVSGTVRSGDVEIAYRRFGAPGATPILIVHGLSYFSYDWIGPGSRLAMDREVVAIDMRGFGESGCSPNGDYRLETHAADLIAVVDSLHWPRTVLIGHSFGGRVCLAAAGWNAERTAALICVDFAPDVAAAGRRQVAERIGRQPDVFASVEEAMSYHGFAAAAADVAVRTRWAAFLRRTDQGYVLKRDPAYRESFRRILDGQPQPAPAFLWPMVADLKAPALFVRGTRSNMFEPQTLDKIKQVNPRAVAVELEGGHDLGGDNPDGLLATVQGFLRNASL